MKHHLRLLKLYRKRQEFAIFILERIKIHPAPWYYFDNELMIIQTEINEIEKTLK